MVKKVFTLVSIAILVAAAQIPWIPVRIKELAEWTRPSLEFYANADHGTLSILSIRDAYYQKFMGNFVYKFTIDVLVIDSINIQRVYTLKYFYVYYTKT